MVVAFCNLAGAFGGAIAFGIGHVNGAAGLEGFRWLFIVSPIKGIECKRRTANVIDRSKALSRFYQHYLSYSFCPTSLLVPNG